MATRNYRQAKRNREEVRKKRKQEKIDRKLGRATAAQTTEPDVPSAAEKQDAS